MRTCCFLLFLFIGSLSAAYAQCVVFSVYASDFTSRIRKENVVVSLYQNDSLVKRAKTDSRGEFRFDLECGGRYTIELSSLGKVPRHFNIDLRSLSEEFIEGNGSQLSGCEVGLFDQVDSVDYSYVTKHAITTYTTGKNGMLKYDETAAARMAKEIEKIGVSTSVYPAPVGDLEFKVYAVDYTTSVKMSGVTVSLYEGDSLLQTTKTDAKGMSSFGLDYGKRYVIELSSDGRVSRFFIVDLFSDVERLMTPETLPVEGACQVSLFEKKEGVNYSYILQNPITIFHIPEDSNYSLDYREPDAQKMTLEIEKLLKSIETEKN